MDATALPLSQQPLLRLFLRKLFVSKPVTGATLDDVSRMTGYCIDFFDCITELDLAARQQIFSDDDAWPAMQAVITDALRTWMEFGPNVLADIERLEATGQVVPRADEFRERKLDVEAALQNDDEFFLGTPEKQLVFGSLVGDAIAEHRAGLTEPMLPLP